MSTTTPITSVVTYNLALTPAIPKNWGLGLVGYETYLTEIFCFNTTVPAVTDTDITLSTIQCGNTYLIFLKYSYIVSNDTTLNVVSGCTNIFIQVLVD